VTPHQIAWTTLAGLVLILAGVALGYREFRRLQRVRLAEVFRVRALLAAIKRPFHREEPASGPASLSSKTGGAVLRTGGSGHLTVGRAGELPQDIEIRELKAKVGTTYDDVADLRQLLQDLRDQAQADDERYARQTEADTASSAGRQLFGFLLISIGTVVTLFPAISSLWWPPA
jgi:hypothetical protein